MDADSTKIWYFAYGSNLCVEQMRRRCGPIDEGPVARLDGYRVAFNMRGDDGGVYANIVRPGDGVIGVLYRCGEAAMAALDVYEEGYDRRQVTVTPEGGPPQEATVYVARPECIAEGKSPSPEYLGIILRGARAHSVPDAYVRSIEARAAQRHAD